MNKSFKRVWLLLVAVCMVCALFAAVAEEAPACVHDWKLVSVLQAGDCEEEVKGVYKDQCTKCSAVRYESRIEHTYVTRLVDATCTEPQKIREVCAVCGEVNKANEGTIVSGGKPALGHDFEVVYVAAGCENYAGTQEICKRCDHKEPLKAYVKDVDDLYAEPTGHKYEKVVVKATCVAPGKEGLEVCSVCGHKKGEEKVTAIDPVNGHKEKVSAILDAGKCDEPLSGIRSLVCEHCGKDMGYEAFTPDHDLDILKVIVAGNCGTDGVYSVACKNCDHKEPEYVVPATKKHTIKKVELKATCTEPAQVGEMCVVCGGEKKLEKVVGSSALGHKLETVYIKDENCLYEADTIIEKCTQCDFERTERGGKKEEANQHDYKIVEESAILPTCSTPGLTAKKVCADCGDVIEGQIVPALKEGGHENVIVSVLKPVDCSLEGDAGNGIGKKACKYCGGNVKYEIIPNNHTWQRVELVKPATCGKNGVEKAVCVVCGETDANHVIVATGKHNYVKKTVPATCVDKAFTAEICTVCGDKKNVVVDEKSELIAHDYVKTYIEKDICNYPAGLLMTCSMCEKQMYLKQEGEKVVEINEWTKAHIGEPVKVADVPETCVAEGLINKTICPTCGEIVYKGDVVPKNPDKHVWDVTVLKSVTCKSEENGRNMLTCKLCEKVAYEVVAPKDAHNFVVVDAVEATCIKEGKKEYKCSVCEKETKVEVIPATGKHDYQEVAYAADCENPAKAGKICVICKIGELNNLEGSEALGHKWGDEKVVSATCYNPAGVMKTCSACAKQVVTKLDGTEVDLKDYAAHTVVVKAEAPTCSTKGYEGKEICSVCQKVIKEGTELDIEKTNHKNVLSVVLKAADCTKGEVDGKGIGKYACEYCGEFGYYGEITIDKAHDIKETVTKPATCGEAGKKTVACTKCSYTEEKEIEKLKAHTIEEVSIPASCEDVAYVGTMCVVCKGEQNLMKVAGSKELGHKWTETVVKETCYNPAGVMKSCSTCGTKLVDTLDGNVVNLKGYKNHTSKDVKDIAATCTTTGWEGKKVCSVCNEVLEEGKIVEIDKTAHKNGIVEILKEADCLNGVPGIAKIGCEYCGTLAANPYRSITEADTAVYHKLVVSSIKDKDCGNNGEKVTVCSVCGDKFVEVLPMTNEHKYVEKFMDADCEKAARYGKQCSVCGDEVILNVVEGSVALGHDWLETVQAQTCEHGYGVYKICKVCGDEDFDELDKENRPALNHKIDGVLQLVDGDVEATCHSEGIEGRLVCKLCGEEFVKTGYDAIKVIKPDASKHAPVLDEVITAATCKVPGTARYVCKYGCEGWYTEKFYTVDCEYTEEKIDATGTLVYVECKSCGEVIVKKDFAKACEHTFVAVKGYAATEEADGLTAGKKCTKCSVVLYGCEKIPMITCKHADVEILAAKAATCTEKGLTEGKKCNECGLTLVEQKEIPALAEGGHTEVVLEAKAATCTEAGLTEGKKCSVCEAIIVAQEEIAALGHKEVELAGKEATCTEDGLTAGKQCTVCEEITVKQEVIVAAGHTIVALEAKDATCEEAGLTAGEKCSVCGVITKAQEEIAALGHKYTVTWDFNEDFTKKLKIFTCDVCGDTYTEEMDF